MFVSDPTGVVLWFSGTYPAFYTSSSTTPTDESWYEDAFYSLTGLDPEKALSPQIWLDVFHPDDLPRVLVVRTLFCFHGCAAS
jgi:hypothetical protein